MAVNFRHLESGLNIVPRPDGATAPNSQGDLAVSSADGKLYYNDGSSTQPILTGSSSGTITNKLLSSSTVWFVDSVDNTKAIKFDDSGATTGTSMTILAAQTANRILTLPDATDTLVGRATTDTLTNKSINASLNTITNLTNASFSGSAAITNANLAAMPAHTIKGNNTASPATPLDLTGTQVTAELDVFTSVLKGLVPASGGGTANFLRADGTFATPPNSGGTITTVGTYDSQAPAANGLVISGANIYAQSASVTVPGMVNGLTQSFAGNKTFTGTISTSTINDTGGGISISASNNQNLTLNTFATGQLKLAAANGVGIFEQASTPTAPASGYSAIYPKTNHLFYSLDSLGVERPIGSGGGGLNFMILDTSFFPSNQDNSTAENSLGSWATYASGGAVPTTLTGGSATSLTLSRTVTVGEILDGSASFKVVKTATNAQGQGVSALGNIPLGYRGQTATITMPFKILSGSIATGDLKLFIQDVTNSTIITPSNNDIPATGGLITASFIVPATCAQFRIGIHFATTSATAVTFSFDDVIVAPQNASASFGSADISMTPYTPVITGFGTPTSVNFQYARKGDEIHIIGSFLSGVPTAVTAAIGLPSGLVSSSSLATNQVVGDMVIDINSSGAFTTLISPSATSFNVSYSNVAGGGASPQLGNGVATNGSVVRVNAMFPIAGWSANPVTNVALGTVMAGSDWKNDLVFTPSASFTATNTNFWYRRVGDSMHVRANWDETSPTASTAFLTLPTGYTINSSKFSNQTNLQAVGNWWLNRSIVTPYGNSSFLGNMFYDGSDTSNLYFAFTGSSSVMQKGNANDAGTGTGSTVMEFVIPITGWDSAVVIQIPSPQQFLWSGKHINTALTNDAVWTVSSATYLDFSNNEASISLSETNNVNFGTVSGYGASSGASALPGIVFTPPTIGYYFVKASFAMDKNGTNISSVRMIDGSGTSIDASSHMFQSSGQFLYSIGLSGIYHCSDLTQRTIKLQGATEAAAGTLSICGTYIPSSSGIEWSIYKIN